MSNHWYEGDPGDENDNIAPDDLSDIFLDEETLKIAAQAEKYRREYEAPKQKGD
jgi:hypothetical protein